MHTSAHPPICAHCQHFRKGEANFVKVREPECHSPFMVIKTDIVTGSKNAPPCRQCRSEDGKCGPLGNLFAAASAPGHFSHEEAVQWLQTEDIHLVRAPYASAEHWEPRMARDTCGDPIFIGATNESSARDVPPATVESCIDSPPSFLYNPVAPTVALIGPQGCGKSTHAAAFAKALGCTHVIDGETLNGFDVDNPADTPRAGALVITTERAQGGDADLIIEARTKAGFDKVVSLLPSVA